MKYSKNDIESRLKNLIEESEDKQTGSCSLICKILSVVGFIIFVVGVPAALYIGLEWNNSVVNYNEVDNNYKELEENLAKNRTESKRLKEELEKYEVELENIKEDIKNTTNSTEEIKKNITEIDKKIAEVKANLTNYTTERDKLKSTNDELKSKNDIVSKELANLEETLKKLNSTLTSNYNSKMIWQIVSGAGIFFTAVGASIDTYLHLRRSKIEIDAQRGKQYSEDYKSVVLGFENFVFLNRIDRKIKELKQCFYNGNKKDLEKCKGIKRPLISISTNSGYYFSIYLEIPWEANEGSYDDPNSVIISANHAAIAKITSSGKNALTIRSETLMEFGNSGIVISLDGKSGTAIASAYNVPDPHNKDNFLNGKSPQFDIAYIKIEDIVLI